MARKENNIVYQLVGMMPTDARNLFMLHAVVVNMYRQSSQIIENTAIQRVQVSIIGIANIFEI